MAKAGLIDEMMNDALDSALDNEDIEEETDAEVEKVRHCHHGLKSTGCHRPSSITAYMALGVDWVR
jgi:hypothetical protein